ncbi:Proline--tRNA ligase [Gossypium arboreum]|uniref:Proline--tRNA ligase n=1 Tax=Gossypium arboreum TaxID=29729 RepID=A0A0B0MYN6_GOSAR|nr:Proline--tRNA ligase [Gossypium arboreum]
MGWLVLHRGTEGAVSVDFGKCTVLAVPLQITDGSKPIILVALLEILFSSATGANL